MIKGLADVGLALLAGLLAVTAAGAGNVPDRTPLVLVCSVVGAAPAKSGLSRQAICARFADRLSRATGAPIVLARARPQDVGQRWVQADLRLLARDRIEARLTSYLHANATNFPPFAVHAMDKPLGLGEIDQLANHAARLLGQG